MDGDDFSLRWEEEINIKKRSNTEVPICSIENVQSYVNMQSDNDQMAAENLMFLAQDVVSFVEPEELDQNVECVTEEVITDDWVPGGQERVEVPLDQLTHPALYVKEENDLDVPLPTDQDEYTAMRPWPCDFCSRRFRKKAALMNHMVAHQNDRPHACNLCGVRYVRKCDLMNHLKVHAFVPDDTDEIDYEDIEKSQNVKPKKKRGRRKKIPEPIENGWENMTSARTQQWSRRAKSPARPPPSPPSPPRPKHELSASPKLFHRRNSFQDDPPEPQGKLHRSETVPAGTVSSSLVSLGNTLKISFGRYSPARLSLRKDNINIGNYFSPTSIAGKKSNEFLQSGLNSLKSAATTMAKKLDEMKEVISANSTPVKGAIGSAANALNSFRIDDDGTDASSEMNPDELIGGTGFRRASSDAELACSMERGSLATLIAHLPDNLYPNNTQPPPTTENAVVVHMSSCSQCHQCLALLYDEDIMAGWAADDSNLNTRCTACGRHTVPLLTIKIMRPEQTQAETLSVPYLNPLVLRKEFESVLGREGDSCLAESEFVESHPIVYWNLVWFLERANIDNHLPDLLCSNFQAKYQSTDNLSEADKSERTVECAWERIGEAEAGALHRAWRRRRTQRGHSRALQALLLTEHDAAAHAVALAVLNGLLSNNLTDALKKLVEWRENINDNKRHYSFYRDILFLAMAALGEQNIDVIALQREYTRALDQIGEEARSQDLPPSPTAICCRHYFKRLRLIVDD